MCVIYKISQVTAVRKRVIIFFIISVHGKIARIVQYRFYIGIPCRNSFGILGGFTEKSEVICVILAVWSCGISIIRIYFCVSFTVGHHYPAVNIIIFFFKLFCLSAYRIKRIVKILS